MAFKSKLPVDDFCTRLQSERSAALKGKYSG